MEGTPTSARAPAAEMGGLARLLGVFFSPARTFESIARKPAWVVPFVLMIVFTLGASYLVTSRLDVDTIVEKQLAKAEERGAQASPSDAETAKKFTEVILKIQPIIGTVFLVLMLLVVPALYHGLALAWGKATSYVAVFSAYLHVQMVQLLKGVLLTAVAVPRETLDPEKIGGMLKSNVGAFVDAEQVGPALHQLLSQLDVFDMWGMALTVVALTRVTRFTPRGAAAVVVSLWGVYVLIVVAFRTLGAAFGGG